MSSSGSLFSARAALAILAFLSLMACDSGEPQTGNADATIAVVAESETGSEALYGFGRAVSDAEVAGWDIDIRPDGLGLPPGEGSVEDGEVLYEEQCASCHGLFGEGEGRWPKLAGGMDTLSHERPERTVGSYWPYASTLWDYIHRAMPFTAPQSLTDDETYAITAYVLYLNDLVDDDFVLSRDNFTTVRMPNQDGFFVDDRPDVSNTRCMENCKDSASITIVESLFFEAQASDEESEDEPDNSSDTETVDRNNEISAVAEGGQALAGKSVYDSACKVCHGVGLAGAPVPGNAETWKLRLEQGMDVVYRHAIEGYQGSSGVMPPKGGQLHLEDSEVKAAVDYMSGQN